MWPNELPLQKLVEILCVLDLAMNWCVTHKTLVSQILLVALSNIDSSISRSNIKQLKGIIENYF
jgi:hypothetical protein